MDTVDTEATTARGRLRLIMDTVDMAATDTGDTEATTARGPLRLSPPLMPRPSLRLRPKLTMVADMAMAATVTATDTAATTARGPPMLTTVATDTEATTEATDTVDTTARGPLRLITDTVDTAVTDTETATVTAGASKLPAPIRLIPNRWKDLSQPNFAIRPKMQPKSIICHCKPSFLCLKYSNLVPLPCVHIRFQKVGCC